MYACQYRNMHRTNAFRISNISRIELNVSWVTNFVLAHIFLKKGCGGNFLKKETFLYKFIIRYARRFFSVSFVKHMFSKLNGRYDDMHQI